MLSKLFTAKSWAAADPALRDAAMTNTDSTMRYVHDTDAAAEDLAATDREASADSAVGISVIDKSLPPRERPPTFA